MVASNCAAPRISGEYESMTTELFIASMIVFQKTRHFEFAIGGKSMTNLDRNGPTKSWMWSRGPLQTRLYDLDGRQTSYPYTATGTVSLTHDLGDRIKNPSGTLAKNYGYDGPRPLASLEGATPCRQQSHRPHGPQPLRVNHRDDLSERHADCGGQGRRGVFDPGGSLEYPESDPGGEQWRETPRIQAARGMRRFQKKITGATAIP